MIDKDIIKVAGSFLITGFHSTRLDEDLSVLIRKLCPLGLIFFYRNIRNPFQVRSLCRDVQKLKMRLTGEPLVLCLDQEGGYVGRFREREVLYPSPMALAASGSKKMISSAGYYSNSFLKERGINTNLSPVADVDVNPFNPSLGPRSFSSSPRNVSRLALEWIKGAKRTGILLVAKHFPGKGRSETDSHLSLPRVRASFSLLKNVDLFPFRKIIRRGIDAVMTSHAWYSGIEKDLCPGTFSKKLNTVLLRDTLRFRGLLFSDDLEMGAIAERYDIGEAAVRSVLSGVDAVLICKKRSSVLRAHRALCRAVQSGRIPQKIIEKSLERKKIFYRKIERLLPVFQRPVREKAVKDLSLRTLRKYSPKVLTVLKGRSFLPLDKRSRISFLISSRHPRILVEDRQNEQKDFKKLLSENGLVRSCDIILYRSEKELLRKINQGRASRTAVFFSSDLFRDDMQKKAFHAALSRFQKVVCVITKNPADFLFVREGCHAAIATYCLTYDIQQALLQLLFHGEGGSGRLPVRLK